MRNESKLKCTRCGKDLELSAGFDGCDWESVAGEKSGFKYTIALVCNDCGRVYPIGRLKNYQDFCENIEKLRPYGREENLQRKDDTT